MALPAVAVVAAKGYQAYKTAKTAKKGFDSAAKLVNARQDASSTLDQTKSAVHKLDGGLAERQQSGKAGQEIDLPKMAGIFPSNEEDQPNAAAPGTKPEERGLLDAIIGRTTDAMQENHVKGPEQDSPSTPGM